MGAILEVDSSRKLTTASEAQLHKDDRVWEGSVERNCEPMDKNRIRGIPDQGEQTLLCEAFVVKEEGNKIRRLCREGSRSYLGRSRLVSERTT